MQCSHLRALIKLDLTAALRGVPMFGCAAKWRNLKIGICYMLKLAAAQDTDIQAEDCILFPKILQCIMCFGAVVEVWRQNSNPPFAHLSLQLGVALKFALMLSLEHKAHQ